MTEQQVHVRDKFAKYVIITEKIIFFFLSFTYYLAVLGLARCLQALSHCSEWGLLSSWAAQASRHTAQALGHLGFSSCGAWG